MHFKKYIGNLYMPAVEAQQVAVFSGAGSRHTEESTGHVSWVFYCPLWTQS